jgi:hypothetical protein
MSYTRWSCGWIYLAAILAVVMAAERPLLSQIQTRPGSRRRNYPLGGLGVPMPDLPQVNYRGTLKKIDNKIITLELRNGQTFNFQRSGKTKFYKDSKEIKSSDLHIGEPLSVDATEDPQAFLDAVKVTFDDSPPADEDAAAVPDSNSSKSLPQTIQYGENGRPTLSKRPSEMPQRSNPGEPAIPASPSVPSSPESAGVPGSPPHFDDVPAAPPPQDALIEKARSSIESFSSRLPNLICQEAMARFTRDANAESWQPLDVVSTDLVYEDGKESHLNVKIDGQPADQQELSGSWPIRTLLTTLGDLLAASTAAQFRVGGESNLADLQARIYDFDVPTESSRWMMRMGSESIHPAYGGTIYIEKESGRVLRLEMQARDLPQGFPLDRLETDVEYSMVRIGEEQTFLPMHVETMGCQRDTHACSRSVIDFRNYHKDPADKKNP